MPQSGVESRGKSVESEQMPSEEFQRRLQEIAEKRAPNRSAQAVKSLGPISDRGEHLRRALAALAHGGIKGNAAYAPLFRQLARRGLIIKPLHFWSFVSLVLFGFATITACLALGVGMAIAMDHYPRPIAAMLEAGPVVFLAISGTLGVLFAAFHKVQARSAALPRWKDL